MFDSSSIVIYNPAGYEELAALLLGWINPDMLAADKGQIGNI